MEEYTEIISEYKYFDLFDLKTPKCPIMIPDTVLLKHSNSTLQFNPFYIKERSSNGISIKDMQTLQIFSGKSQIILHITK